MILYLVDMKQLYYKIWSVTVAMVGMAMTGCGILWSSVDAGTDGITSVGVSVGSSYGPYYSPYYSPYYGSTWYPNAGGYYPWRNHWHRPWVNHVASGVVVPSYRWPSPSGSNPGISRPWRGVSHTSIVPRGGIVPNLNGSNPGIIVPPAGSGMREGR